MSTFELSGQPEKLQGKGTSGDYILSNQRVAKDEGFANVSKIWYDKTISVEQALENLAKGREAQHDYIVDFNKFAPAFDNETGEVFMEDWGQEKRFKLTPHAWRQYATRIDLPHTYVNWALAESLKPNGDVKYEKNPEDSKTFYNVLMNQRRHFKDSTNLLIRTYNDNVCRAVLTEKYTPISNEWFLRELGDLIPGGRVSHHQYSNPDTLRFNILIPDTIREEKDSGYGGMISVTNCEIGLLTNSGTPSLFRAICRNGCIWDQEKGVSWRQIHKGKFDQNDLSKVMVECIQKQIPLVDTIVKKFLAAREWELGTATVQQLLTQLAIDHSLNGEQTVKLFECYAVEGEKNGGGIINAITRFGQTQDADTWTRMDTVAGHFISQGEKAWEKLVNKATNVTDEDLEKLLKKKTQQTAMFSLVTAL